MSSIIQFINARLVNDDQLVSQSLWVDSVAGVFVSSPDPALVTSTIDLQGRILSPGFIDLQINGAYGFDFSEDASEDKDGASYTERYSETRQKLIRTGTTSFLPTMTSQHADRYHRVSMTRKKMKKDNIIRQLIPCVESTLSRTVKISRRLRGK